MMPRFVVGVTTTESTAQNTPTSHQLNTFFYNALLSSGTVRSPGRDMFVIFYDQFARILDVIDSNRSQNVKRSSQTRNEVLGSAFDGLTTAETGSNKALHMLDIAQALSRFERFA
jgi:hypothetical protein